jgi:hypothetical protein
MILKIYHNKSEISVCFLVKLCWWGLSIGGNARDVYIDASLKTSSVDVPPHRIAILSRERDELSSGRERSNTSKPTGRRKLDTQHYILSKRSVCKLWLYNASRPRFYFPNWRQIPPETSQGRAIDAQLSQLPLKSAAHFTCVTRQNDRQSTAPGFYF